MPNRTDVTPAPRMRSGHNHILIDQINDSTWPADSLDDCYTCGAKPGQECRTVFRKGIFHTPWTHKLLARH